MKKFATIVGMIEVFLMLVSLTALAQEQEPDSQDKKQKIMVCYQGKTMIVSEKKAEKFLQLGGVYGACADDPATTSSQQPGQAQKPAKDDKQAGQAQKPDKDDKQAGQAQKPAKDNKQAGQAQKPAKDNKQAGQAQKPAKDNKQAGQSQEDRDTDETNGQGQGQPKVTICHKGKNTITIAEPALSAHLAHGDMRGACTGNGQQSEENMLPNKNTEDTNRSQTNTPPSGKKQTNDGKNRDSGKNTGKKGGKKDKGNK